jgi:cell division protein FtsW
MVAGGFLIFSSASLGLMARGGASFGAEAFSQFMFGVLGGGALMLLISNVYYLHWRRYAFYIFGASLLATLLVFSPLGVEHGGATRWINLGITTVQPAEFLKIGFVVYLATWFSGVHSKISQWKYGLIPLVVTISLVGSVMLIQPDTDTFLIIAASGVAMFMVAGAKWRDLAVLVVGSILLLTSLVMALPHVKDRVTTFMNPEADPLGSGYQINQSLIAVGAGGATGRGYGQSIQKFQYLPEPTSDSIFAVYAEEFGYLGSIVLIATFVFLTLRGYRIAAQAADNFGALLVVGFMTILVAQAFLNIAAMVALAPLSGLPLPFVSHGGTALMAVLASLGIILNVSKYRILHHSA